LSSTFRGGCACGDIRYEITDEPLEQNDCQCRDCQHVSGTGHGSYLTFANRQKVTLEGAAAHWEMVGDNGNRKTRGFCPRCGAPVYLTFSYAPAVFTIHAASLDDPSLFRPQAVTYTSRGYAWDHLAPALTKFDKMPPR
jgi:hypothetical protein